MLFCADVQDTKINRQSDVPTVKVVETQRADCETQTEKKNRRRKFNATETA